MRQPADYVSAVHTACLRGDIDRTEELLKWNQAWANQRNENGQTPLHVVAVTAEGTVLEDLMNLLIYFQADPNARSPIGDTVLHDVINVGRMESAYLAVPILLRAGAEPKVANRLGQTAIDLAILQDYQELAQLMQDFRDDPQKLDDWEKEHGQQAAAKKPPPEKEKEQDEKKATEDQEKKNHLMLNAVIRGEQNKVKELLQDGAAINFKNKEGFTALHYAVSRCASDREAMTRLLAVDNMADVNATTEESDTALTLSIKKNHSEEEVLKIAGILLEQGAKKDTKDLDEKDALQLATAFRLPKVVALLSDGEAPKPEENPPSSDPNHFEGDYHPVHLLCKEEDLEKADREKKLDAEFGKGVYINIRTKPERDTCLMIACRRQDEALVRYLLSKDATVSVENEEDAPPDWDFEVKDTPLSITRALKNRPIEQLLLEAQRRQQARSQWRKAGVTAAAASKSKGCALL